MGDVKYGGALVETVETRAAAEVSFIRLHAARLRLPRGGGGDNRGDGRFVEVEAPKPRWFEETSDGEYARERSGRLWGWWNGNRRFDERRARVFFFRARQKKSRRRRRDSYESSIAVSF